MQSGFYLFFVFLSEPQKRFSDFYLICILIVNWMVSICLNIEFLDHFINIAESKYL